MTRGSQNQDGSGPEPPKVVSIVIASVFAALMLVAIFGLVNLLR